MNVLNAENLALVGTDVSGWRVCYLILGHAVPVVDFAERATAAKVYMEWAATLRSGGQVPQLNNRILNLVCDRVWTVIFNVHDDWGGNTQRAFLVAATSATQAVGKAMAELGEDESAMLVDVRLSEQDV